MWHDLIYSYYIVIWEKSVDIGMFVFKLCKNTINIRDNNEKNNSSTHNPNNISTTFKITLSESGRFQKAMIILYTYHFNINTILHVLVIH